MFDIGYEDYCDNMHRDQTDDTYCPTCKEHSMIEVDNGGHGFQFGPREVYWVCSNECEEPEYYDDGEAVHTDRDAPEWN